MGLEGSEEKVRFAVALFSARLSARHALSDGSPAGSALTAQPPGVIDHDVALCGARAVGSCEATQGTLERPGRKGSKGERSMAWPV